MNINRHMIIPLEGFGDVAQLVGTPTGNLFEFGLNPWNGNIVLAWQDNTTARFYIRLILSQLSKFPDLFDEKAVKAYYSGQLDLDEATFELSPYDLVGVV